MKLLAGMSLQLQCIQANLHLTGDLQSRKMSIIKFYQKIETIKIQTQQFLKLITIYSI